MIVVDRVLSESEREALDRSDVVDLRDSKSNSRGFRDMMLAWLDSNNLSATDDHPFLASFKIDGVSYWYHIRARLFYQLARHAQFRDRVGNNFNFDNVTEVFCSDHEAEFWRFWVPDANVILPQESRTPIIWQRGWKRYLIWVSARFGWPMWKEIKRGCRVLCMSSGGYTETRNGALWDRHLGPLLDKTNDWLRLEFVQIPPKGIQQDLRERATMPRSHRSVQTDALLVSQMITRPWRMALLLVHVAILRARFRSLPDHPFVFPTDNRKWQELVKVIVKTLPLSIGLFHQYRLVFERAIKLSKAKSLFVVSENNSVGRILVEAGRRLSVPTFGVQHGSIDPHNADYRLPKNENLPLRPDFMFVWGAETREYLISECGYRGNSTMLTGRLFSDTVGLPEPDEGITALRKRTNKPVLLFTSQPPGVFNAYRIRAAEDLAKFCRENDLACMIRLHPRELDDGLYQRVFEEQNWTKNFEFGSGNLYPTIAAADFGATCYSTTGIEVMWMGKPLVLFDPFNQDLLGLRGNAFVYFVGSEQTPFRDWSARSERHALEGRDLAERRLGPRNPHAAERILDVIENIINRSS